MNLSTLKAAVMAIVIAATSLGSAPMASASGIPLDGSRILTNAPIGGFLPFNPHTQAGNPSGNELGTMVPTRYITVETDLLVGVPLTNVPFSIAGKTYTVAMVQGHSATIDLGINDGFTHSIVLNPYLSNATALVFTLRANDGALVTGR